MANGDDEPSRPRQITAANVWEAFDRLRDETREARHSQSNQITRVIAEESKETRELIGGLDARVRMVETAIANPTPSTLGQRLGDMEKWQAVISSTNLPDRVDHIESTLDQMRGSVNLVKYLQIVVSLALGVVGLMGWFLLQRPT